MEKTAKSRTVLHREHSLESMLRNKHGNVSRAHPSNIAMGHQNRSNLETRSLHVTRYNQLLTQGRN